MDKVKAAYDKETGVEEAQEAEEEVGEGQVLVDSDNVHLSLPEVLLKNSSGDDDAEGQTALEAGVRGAQRRVHGQIQFVVDQDEGLSSELSQTKALQIQGDSENKSYVVIVFDGKVLCESGSQGKYRLPPLRPAQLKRLTGAILEAREGSLQDGDVFVAIDGGKGMSWEDQVVKAIAGKKLSVCRNTVVYTFESCEKRMERASKQPLDMVENISMHSVEPFSAKVSGYYFWTFFL